MKKLTCFILASAFLIPLLSSCGKIETVELNTRLIIESVGIDSDDEMYEVTLEGLDCISTDTGKSDSPEIKLTKCYFFRCDTLGEAVDEVRMQTGLIPLFSQTRAIVIGKTTAEKKLCEILNFFMREYTTRIDILVAVAEHTAKEIISADYGDGISAGKHLEETLESYKYTGTSVYSPLYKIINSSMNKTDAAMCPFVKLTENPFKDSKQLKLDGTIAFSNNKTSLLLDKNQTLAVMLLTSEIDKGYIITESEKGKCTLKIVGYSASTRTAREKNQITISFSVHLKCDIPEFQTDGFADITREDTEKTAQTAARQLTDVLTSALNYAFFENHFDIFEFGRRINLKDRKYYRRNVENNPEFSDNVTCFISVGVAIRRTGKTVIKNEKNRRYAP